MTADRSTPEFATADDRRPRHRRGRRARPAPGQASASRIASRSDRRRRHPGCCSSAWSCSSPVSRRVQTDEALLAVGRSSAPSSRAASSSRRPSRRSPGASRWASWRSGCAPSATTPGRSRSSTRSSARSSAVVEIWRVRRRPGLLRARCSAPAASGWATTPPAPTSSASACRLRARAARRRCRRTLAAWAASADIAPLPDGLALAVRQFLGRAAGLNPARAPPSAASSLEQVMPHVAPPPPPGSTPRRCWRP